MRRNMDMQIGALTMSMAQTASTGEPAPSPGGLRHLDPDTDFKVRRITSYINEAIHMAANEPSLGLYRIQEHVHRTAPQLAVKKKELKNNNNKILETSYDLNLSMDVVHSMRSINNFTRIQEALKTAIEMKRKLNLQDEEEKQKREMDVKNAKIANRSLSCNEPAEGYICPVCYFALSGQEELIQHWQVEHNLEDCENEIFHEVEMPTATDDVVGNVTMTDVTLEGDDDMTVILSPKECRTVSAVSEGEDVVKGFNDSRNNFFELSESTTSSDLSTTSEGSRAEEVFEDITDNHDNVRLMNVGIVGETNSGETGVSNDIISGGTNVFIDETSEETNIVTDINVLDEISVVNEETSDKTRVVNENDLNETTIVDGNISDETSIVGEVNDGESRALNDVVKNSTSVPPPGNNNSNTDSNIVDSSNHSNHGIHGDRSVNVDLQPGVVHGANSLSPAVDVLQEDKVNELLSTEHTVQEDSSNVDVHEIESDSLIVCWED